MFGIVLFAVVLFCFAYFIVSRSPGVEFVLICVVFYATVCCFVVCSKGVVSPCVMFNSCVCDVLFCFVLLCVSCIVLCLFCFGLPCFCLLWGPGLSETCLQQN